LTAKVCFVVKQIPKEEKDCQPFHGLWNFRRAPKVWYRDFLISEFTAVKVFQNRILNLWPFWSCRKLSANLDNNVPYPIHGLIRKGSYSLVREWTSAGAFEKLYRLSEMIDQCTDPVLLKDWQYLQTSDHFIIWAQNVFRRDVHAYFNPYDIIWGIYELYECVERFFLSG